MPKAQADGGNLSQGELALGIVLLGVAVLGTLACSVWLANRRRWWVVGLLAIYVSGLFFAWYLAAMFSVPVPTGEIDTQDNAAAVGMIFLAIPTAVVIGLLVGLGSGVGATVRSIRGRRAPDARIA